MARNEVSRLTISIDIDKATGKILQFNQTIGNTQRKVTQAGQSMTQLAQQTTQAGQAATTSAVNFQTMSQGMLNLSTSAVQTFTSLSNLDRAQNRAKMSVIAVARAEDLLNNKIARKNDMLKAGTASGEKYTNMLREIETATQDLTVKTEKQKIEQGAVTDIYMLFFANIANVGFSTMQTVVALLGQEKAARIGAVLATKLHTVATWDNVRAARVSSTNAKAIAVFWGGAASTGLGIATIKTKLLTAAMHGLKFALGPVGLAMIGISAAFLAYQHLTEDTTKSVDGFTQGVLDSRAAVDGLTDSMDSLSDGTKKLAMSDALPYIIAMQDSYIRSTRGATLATVQEIEVLDQLAARLPNTQGFSKPSGALTPEGTDPLETITSGMGSWNFMPQAFAQEPLNTAQQVSALKPQLDIINRSNFIDGKLIPITDEKYRKSFDWSSPTPDYLLPSKQPTSTKTLSSLEHYQLKGHMGIAKRSDNNAMAAHFYDTKTKLKNKIDVFEKKIQNRDFADHDYTEYSTLKQSYLKYFSGKTIDLYTGQLIGTAPSTDEWGKELSFKYDSKLTATQQNFREAAGYQIPEKKKQEEKINYFKTLYETKGDFGKKMVMNMTNSKFADRYRAFDFGTNVGYGMDIMKDGKIDDNAKLGRGSMIRGLSLGAGEMNDDLANYLGLRTEREQLHDRKYEEALERAKHIKAQQKYGAKEDNYLEGITGQGGFSSYVTTVDSSGNLTTQHTTTAQANRNMGAAEAMGRATWNREQAAQRTGASGGVNVLHWLPTGEGVTDADRAAFQSLASGHGSRLQEEINNVEQGGRERDLTNMRNATIQSAIQLRDRILKRIADEKLAAANYASILGISAVSALATLRDQSQGEQTLMDQVAYQQRLDAMSSGVV